MNCLIRSGVKVGELADSAFTALASSAFSSGLSLQHVRWYGYRWSNGATFQSASFRGHDLVR